MFLNFKELVLCLPYTVCKTCFSFMDFYNKTLERIGRNHSIAGLTVLGLVSLFGGILTSYMSFTKRFSCLFFFFFLFLFAPLVSQSKYTLSFCLTSSLSGEK